MDAAAVEEQGGEVREDSESPHRLHVEPEDRIDSRAAKEPRQQLVTTPAGGAFRRDHEVRRRALDGATRHRGGVDHHVHLQEKCLDADAASEAMRRRASR